MQSASDKDLPLQLGMHFTQINVVSMVTLTNKNEDIISANYRVTFLFEFSRNVF